MSTTDTRLFQNDTSRRLEWLQKELKVNNTEFAKRADVERSYLSAMINHGKPISMNAAMSISENLDVSLNWLLRGIGAPYQFTTLTQEASDFVQIRRFDIEASAGRGLSIVSEGETGHYGFKQEWLDRRGLKPSYLSVISVSGNSMEPELYDRDLVLIDHASTELADSNIYAVRFSDALYVKRIQHQPGGRVLLISKNKDYPPIEIENPIADGVEVIGRIVASMHEW